MTWMPFLCLSAGLIFGLRDLPEKALLPLEELQERLASEKLGVDREVDIVEEENKKSSPLLWIMPASIVAGVLFGYYLLPGTLKPFLGYLLTGSLAVLYVSIGVSLGSNRKVFRYLKVFGFKVVYLSAAIFAGSIAGGFLSGLILGLPYHISVISAGGMSYYSLTGAYMTQVYGIGAGTYGYGYHAGARHKVCRY